MGNYNSKIWHAQDGCGWGDENITTVAANTSQLNYGLTVFSSTKATSIEPPTSGVHKWILFKGTTKAMKLKTAGATINNSTDDVLTVTLASTKAKEMGVGVHLWGASTSKWYLLTTQSATALMVLSSAT